MVTARIIHQLDYIMRRIDAEMHRRVRPIDTARVGPLGSMALTQLSRIAPAPVQKLVEVMGRDASQITRTINRLEMKGLLVRTVSDEDRRIRELDLTPEGRKYVAQLDKILSEILEELLLPLSPDEQEVLGDLLSRL